MWWLWDIEIDEDTPHFFVAAREAGITPSIKSASSVLQSPDPPADVSNEVAVLQLAWVSSVKVNSATYINKKLFYNQVYESSI